MCGGVFGVFTDIYTHSHPGLVVRAVIGGLIGQDSVLDSSTLRVRASVCRREGWWMGGMRETNVGSRGIPWLALKQTSPGKTVDLGLSKECLHIGFSISPSIDKKQDLQAHLCMAVRCHKPASNFSNLSLKGHDMSSSP